MFLVILFAGVSLYILIKPSVIAPTKELITNITVKKQNNSSASGDNPHA